MTLQEWIDQNNLKAAGFTKLAREYEIEVGRKPKWSRTKTHRLLRGKKPSRQEAFDLGTLTNGAVQPNDFYDIPIQPDSPKPPSHPNGVGN